MGSFYESISLFNKFHTFGSDEETSNFFIDYFQRYPEEKLKIQKYYLERSSEHLNFYLFNQTVLYALVPTKEDVEKLLIYIQKQNVTEDNISKWKHLLSLYCGRGIISDEIYRLALPFAQHNKLLDYLNNKKKFYLSDCEIKDKRSGRRRRIDKRLKYKKIRNNLLPYRNKLERGDAKFCNHPAYILLYSDYDIPQDIQAVEQVKYVFGDSLTDSILKGFEASLHNSVPTISELTTQKRYHIEPVLIAGIYCRLLRNETLSDLSDNTILTCAVILDYDRYLGFTFYDNESPKLCETIRDEIVTRRLKKTIIDEMFIPQFQNDGAIIKGLYWVHGKNVDKLSIETIADLLNTYPRIHSEARNQFIDTLINNDELIKISDLIIEKAQLIDENNDDHIEEYSRWLSLLSMIDEKSFLNYLRCAQYPKSVFWQLKETYHETRLTKNLRMSITLMSWIAYRFSYLFPKTDMPTGVFSGSRHPYDASNFITFCLLEISNITTLEAQAKLKKLKNCVHSSYTIFITNLLTEQANNIRDANYQAPMLADLLNVFQNKTPENCRDLKTLILELLDEVQKKIKSSELDSYKMFYEDGKSKNPKIPHGENYCRDRLADLLKPYIEPYQFRLDTEKDMPDDKRADLVCNSSEMQLPIEVKGQWHDDLWTAMNDQLGDLYIKEYQSQGQGIYLIFYFGENTTKKPKKNDEYKPQNSLQLQEFLTACIEDKYKEGIDVFVMDLSIEAT